MAHEDIWLTPEQAAALSGRSMIAVRALIETTLENEGTRHLLQVFENQDDVYGSGYLLHRSLVTSDGLPDVQASDVVERLSARVQELEAENEVLRFRATTVRQDPVVTANVPLAQVAQTPFQQPIPANPYPQRVVVPKQQSSDTGATFWIILGMFILITFVLILFILLKQGFIHLPR